MHISSGKIEQVAIVIRQIMPIPYPLKVWIENDLRDYQSNPYRVTYRGQSVGTVLPAIYVPVPLEHIQLAPGESDELDIQVLSQVVKELNFQIQITYRLTSKPNLYTLTLPNIFDVIFSDALNWHPYRLENGHLVPE